MKIAPISSSNYTGCSQESGFNFTGATSTKNQIATAGYAYDAAGNLTAAPPTGTAYVFDAENHLVSAGGQTYVYDGDGKRVEKASGSPLTANKLYWYDQGGEVIYETNAAGSELYRYFRFQGILVTREESNDWVDHYGVDVLGNVRGVYGTNGGSPYTVNWDASDYYPFGGERVFQSNSTNDRKFTGKERDSESGNDNFAARFYSSSLGRFMSPDPEGAGASLDSPQSWNAYTYALNNPLNLIDPDGLDCAYLNDSGTGVESLDHNSNTEECSNNGGYWYDGTGNAQVIENASGDSSVIPAQTDSVTVTADAPRESYLDCIKNDGDYFSLQHGLQSISGGRYGNGWLSGAVLGNSVSAGIEFGQSLYNRKPSSGVSPAAGEALSRKGGAVAVSAAKNVPNVAVSVAGAAGVAVQTPSLSASAGMTIRASGILPTGTLARAGARLLNGGLELIGHVKDPIDLSVASFSAVACGVGR